MTNAKNTVTQAAAIRFLIDHADKNTPAEVIAAAEKLYTAKTKKRAYTKTESKAARENKELAVAMLELIAANPDELINTVWLNDHMNDPRVRTPQKARAVVNVLIESGDVVKYTDKKKTYYKLA